MVGNPHEAMHRLFQEDPGVFGRAFKRLDLPFGTPTEVEIYTNDLSEHRPVERRVDSLIRVTTDTDGTFLLAVEAQIEKKHDKPSAWAYYVAYLHAAYQIPVVLVVVCQSRSTASWAGQSIYLGLPQWRSLGVFPLVLGPHNVPAVTDADEATSDIPLATLSAITHVNEPDIGAILEALAAAMRQLGTEKESNVFAELTELGLGKTAAAKEWSQLMSANLAFFKSETSQRLRAEGEAKGRAEGKLEMAAENILRLVRARGINVDTTAEQQIRSCRDLELLEQWFNRAITATNIWEVLAD